MDDAQNLFHLSLARQNKHFSPVLALTLGEFLRVALSLNVLRRTRLEEFVHSLTKASSKKGTEIVKRT
jgi:hypothetical protein